MSLKLFVNFSVNGTLRRRMKRRAPLPPNLPTVSTVTLPTSTSAAQEATSPPMERSRPATPPSSTSASPPSSPVKQTPPEEDAKLPSDFQEPATPTSCSQAVIFID